MLQLIRKSRSKGAVIVMVAVALTALLLFVGLSIDVGYWYQRRAQLQLNGDMAVLASMGLMDGTASYASQQDFVTKTITGILNTNGYPSSDFVIQIKPDNPTTPTRVTTAVVTFSQVAPTFFWNVFTTVKPTLSSQSAAEGGKVIIPLPPCAYLAVDQVITNPAIEAVGTSGTVDSYDSRLYPTYSSYTNAATTAYPGGSGTYLGTLATGCANGSIADQHANAGALYSSLGNISAGVVVGGVYAAGSATDTGGTGGIHSNVPNLPLFQLPPVPNPPATGSGSYGSACTAGDSSNATCKPISATFNDNALYMTKLGGGTFPDSPHLSWTGGEILQCGKNYYCTEIQMNGGNNIIVGNSTCASCCPARVYVNGSVKVSGNCGINVDGLATDLTIYGISNTPGASQSFDLGGNSYEHMNIYAPTYDVNMNGKGRMFGNVSAYEVDFKGVGGFSFDSALGLPPAFTTSFRIKVHLVQ